MTRPDLENLRNKHELAAKAAYVQMVLLVYILF